MDELAKVVCAAVVVGIGVGLVRWRSRPARVGVARQFVRFTGHTFLSLFSEGMEWRNGVQRAKITQGIPTDASIESAYFDRVKGHLVVLLRSESTPIGEIDVECCVTETDMGPSRN